MTEFLKRVESIVGRVTEQTAARRAILIDEDGVTYDRSALDPEQYLTCTLFQESREMDYEVSHDVNIKTDRPVAVFRERALVRIPIDGEKWLIRIQRSQFSEPDDMISYAMSGPPRTGHSVGFVNIRLRRVSQI